MIFGVALLILGVLFLLKNLGILEANVSSAFWPMILIIFGLNLLLGKKKQKKD